MTVSRSSSSHPSKKYKMMTSHANGETSITNLPDDLISQILSCLPTKDALRTCVMSMDWEYKWTSIYNIHIDDTTKKGKKTSFVNFAERVVSFCHNVKSFRLSCSQKYDSNRVTAWISTVLSRNVERFEVTYPHAGIVLPRTLLQCNSLTILKLNLPCTFKVSTINCFPNLLNLQLEKVEILNMFSNTLTIKLTFPKMQSCELVRCKWSNVNFVEIFAPALTKFISNRSFDSHCKIKIEEARLTWFRSYDDLLENFILTASSTIDHASLLFNIREDNIPLLANTGLQFRLFLRGLSSLTVLILTGPIMKAISQSKHGGVPLLLSSKLKRLDLPYPCYVEALFELLHVAPLLEYLDVDVYDLDDYDDYEAIDYVPSCMTFNLKTVNFFGFVCKAPHLKLAKYFLKNAAELKIVDIYVSSLNCRSLTERKNEIIEQLSNMPKLSVSLEIVVS